MSKGFSLIKVPRLSNASVGQPFGSLFNDGTNVSVSLQPAPGAFETVQPNVHTGASIGGIDSVL